MDSRVIQCDVGINGNLGLEKNTLVTFFPSEMERSQIITLLGNSMTKLIISMGFVLTLIGLNLKKKRTLNQRKECVLLSDICKKFD